MSAKGVAGAFTAVAVLCAVGVPAPLAHAGSGACYRFKEPERRFARKIDRARAARGLRRLRLDPHLSRVARRHSWEMRRAGALFHRFEALQRRVTNWRLLGENVGLGATVGSLHRAFMASPEHRANVLRRAFRHVGVSVVREGGRMWVTIVFESRRDPGTTLPMPSC